MSKFANETIFLVDDDEDLGFLMKRSFEHALPEANIIYFADAMQCMRRLELSEQPTVLVTDLDMPVISGFQFIQWIRERSAMTFPLVVFSGSVALNQDLCSKLGADAFVTKGRGFVELLHCVHRLMEPEEVVRIR